MRGWPRGPILSMRWEEMKPGDFLKAVSAGTDVPHSPPDVNDGTGPFEAAGLV